MTFKVYKKGEYPKKKKEFFKETFDKRRQARNFCRNRFYLYEGLTIVHPNGKEEPYTGSVKHNLS